MRAPILFQSFLAKIFRTNNAHHRFTSSPKIKSTTKEERKKKKNIKKQYKNHFLIKQKKKDNFNYEGETLTVEASTIYLYLDTKKYLGCNCFPKLSSLGKKTYVTVGIMNNYISSYFGW